MKANLIYLPAVSEIYDFAYSGMRSLPKSFRSRLRNFIIEVRNFAELAILQELKMRNRYDLLGLYRGVPVPRKKKNDAKTPDRIYLYRCPLIKHSRETALDVKTLVGHVLINEIGHHFGCTPGEMAEIHYRVKLSPEN